MARVILSRRHTTATPTHISLATVAAKRTRGDAAGAARSQGGGFTGTGPAGPARGLVWASLPASAAIKRSDFSPKLAEGATLLPGM